MFVVQNAADLVPAHRRILLYSQPGLGKTSCLAQLPGRTLIIDCDKGCKVLIGMGRRSVDIVQVSDNPDEVLEIVEDLQRECAYDTVCLDSLTQYQNRAKAHYVKIGSNGKKMELGQYQDMDYDTLHLYDELDRLKCHVVLTAWEDQFEKTLATGERIYIAKPQLFRRGLVDTMCGVVDVVGRISVTPDGQRYIALSGDLSTVAKDRIEKRPWCWPQDLIPADNSKEEK